MPIYISDSLAHGANTCYKRKHVKCKKINRLRYTMGLYVCHYMRNLIRLLLNTPKPTWLRDRLDRNSYSFQHLCWSMMTNRSCWLFEKEYGYLNSYCSCNTRWHIVRGTRLGYSHSTVEDQSVKMHKEVEASFRNINTFYIELWKAKKGAWITV